MPSPRPSDGVVDAAAVVVPSPNDGAAVGPDDARRLVNVAGAAVLAAGADVLAGAPSAETAIYIKQKQLSNVRNYLQVTE